MVDGCWCGLALLQRQGAGSAIGEQRQHSAGWSDYLPSAVYEHVPRTGALPGIDDLQFGYQHFTTVTIRGYGYIL